jgi:RNA polymerase sigma-54 factor
MLDQKLQLKLSQKLSPQQIQLMKMIQLPTVAFEQRVQQEIEENPALEPGKESDEEEFKQSDTDEQEDEQREDEVIETEFDVDDYLSDDDIPSYRTQSSNQSPDDDEKSIPYASGKSFAQYLNEQLGTYRLDEKQSEVAEFIIGSLDESGYMRRPIPDIVDDLAFTRNLMVSEDEVLQVLELVQRLDPPGVAARDLQECLKIQLDRKEDHRSSLAYKIIDRGFKEFSKKHYEKLCDRFDITEQQLKEAIELIEHLNPKPGASFDSDLQSVEQVIPDFTITIKNGELELQLNSRNAPSLHISKDYNEMLKGYKESKNQTRDQKKAVYFIKQKLDSAKWFIDAIKQRQNTLYMTMKTIMEKQREYFLTGDERNLKPMILKDVAEEIDLDISTVSRVANSKYVDTPYGTMLIKEFFSESMKNEKGEDVSTREIKKILHEIIDNEDKKDPYTDAALVKELKAKGYPIARRTVAKYREQLDLPVARLRKELS